MCGIVGEIVIANGSPDFHSLNDILQMSRSRGRQATGVFLYQDPQNNAIVKEPGFFLRLDAEDSRLNRVRFTLGHVRKSSKGSFLDNIANHPHRKDNLILVHNGTASSYIDLAKKLGVADNHGDNDSYAILSLIHRGVNMGGLSVQDSMAEVLSCSNLGETYAIVLFDTETGICYFARNWEQQDRPLFGMVFEDRLVFASEVEFLEKVYGNFQMHGVTLKNNFEFPKGVITFIETRGDNTLRTGVKIEKEPSSEWWLMTTKEIRDLVKQEYDERFNRFQPEIAKLVQGDVEVHVEMHGNDPDYRVVYMGVNCHASS